MHILSDKNFVDEYNNIIVPFCEAYEKSDFFTARDGKNMHYLCYLNNDAKANILMLHGFTESAKKLDEMAFYFYNEGYNVFALDLRGHGLSYKDTAPKYGVDSKSFEFYAKDIADFVKSVINSNLPLFCFTHSLGGNALLLALMNEGVKADKIVLSSPMICGNMGMPVAVASAVAKVINRIGKGDMPAPNKCVFNPDLVNTDATSIERGDHYLSFKKNNSEYQTCGPTFRWVMHSIKARDEILKPENIEKLNTKILLIKPEKDQQLLEKYQDEFISLCRDKSKDIMVIQTSNTYHEIYQSKQEQLEKYLETILNFFG